MYALDIEGALIPRIGKASGVYKLQKPGLENEIHFWKSIENIQ